METSSAVDSRNARTDGDTAGPTVSEAAPLISVIVPVYNTEKYLEKCIDSIRNQTYRNLQIILIDDGSRDRSGEICDSFAKADPRIQVIHKQNEGQAKARNIGLDHAKGEYIAFVDSDDYILPAMYETLYRLMAQYQAQIVCCRIECIDSAGKRSYFSDRSDDFEVFSTSGALLELLHNTRVTSSPCDKLYSRTVFDGVRMIEGMIFEDFEVMHRCVARAQRVVYTPEIFYCNYFSEGSTMRAHFNERHFDNITASRMRTAFYKENSPENFTAAQVSHISICLDVLYRASVNKDLQEKRKALAKEILQYVRENPSIPLSSRTKIKLTVLRFGLPAFDAFMGIFFALTKK